MKEYFDELCTGDEFLWENEKYMKTDDREQGVAIEGKKKGKLYYFNNDTLVEAVKEE